mgnify:CR=1 FL=1
MITAAKQFRADARQMTADARRRQLVQTALGKYEIKRDEKKALFQNWAGARQAAATTKWQAVQ